MRSSYDNRVAGISSNIFTIFRLGIEASRELTPQVIKEVTKENPNYIIYDIMVYFGRVIKQKFNLPAIVSIPTFVFKDKTISELPLRSKLNILRMAISGIMDIVKMFLSFRWYKKNYGVRISDFFFLNNYYTELNIKEKIHYLALPEILRAFIGGEYGTH